MPTKNRQVLLQKRPQGEPTEEDFALVDTTLDDPRDGQVLVRNRFLSLDPYMRGRMSDAKSYAPPVDIGDVMIGGTVGEVVATKHPRFHRGDVVSGMLGWQEHGLADGASPMLVKIKERPGIPLSAYLGAAGMPGITAYHGLFDIGAPKPGETVAVAAAAGAVGSIVGQLAKLAGCRAVGIAGGAEKCAHVVKDLGFDACVDHRSKTLKDDLAAATPAGIDVYFENVGGELLELVLGRLNPFARIPLCGMVSQYNATEPYGVKNLIQLLTTRARLQGFIVSDRMDRWPEAQQRLAGWLAEKKLVFRETIAEGLDSAPRAFIGMLRGENLGKQLVRL